MNTSHLSGRTIVITGGSSGIGLALAQIVVERGAVPIIVGRNEQRLASALAALGSAGSGLAADCTRPADWDRIIDHAQRQHGGIDVLVQCHGAGGRIAPLEHLTASDIDQVIAINLSSVINGCRTVLPHMRAVGRGHIVTVGSACSYRSWPEWSVYTAAKAGLVGFTRCLHREMVEWGGKATFFAPGAAQTGFQQAAGLEVDLSGYPTGADMAAILAAQIDLPDHLFVEHCAAWGTAQVVTPF
ncbi:MAG: SDR family NAD(P)-dependent oxidoreductase [Planctomycetota bacterium]|nr:SDR family NAD(P)-dependent oxidoreductase [Planctomycetota bacterium]